MKSAASFLIAARQCEIAELERLAQACELASRLGRFVHALQRERGLANIYLASRGVRFASERRLQAKECDSLALDVAAGFERLDTEAEAMRNGTRLFSRIAVVLHALDGLPALRERIETLQLAPGAATAAYVRLIAGLLNVVFEAADSAGDPEISRALAALFNFMQGKEFAGQERAVGAAMFAMGRADGDSQRRWRHLVEQQQACFQLFVDFSDAATGAAHRTNESAASLAELDHLRRTGGSARDGDLLDTALSGHWYDCCTRRIDAMRGVEDQLAANLGELCRVRITRAQAELRDHQALVAALDRAAGASGEAPSVQYGHHFGKSMPELLHEQAGRLLAMGDELDKVRAALAERKVVERAKGLLMAHRRLTEEEAYKALRQMAMNQKRRLVDVAEAVLAMADVLPHPAR